MKRLITGFFLVLAFVWVTSCTYPDTRMVTRGENRPALAIEGAPVGSVLEVDGINHGDASVYNGDPTTLLIESGSHKVRVLQGTNVLLSQDVYVSNGETRILTLKRN
jgi:hypothetical protein